jgi:tRNA(Ile)-lysidine synthase
MELLKHLTTILDKYQKDQQLKNILVAVSGGVDSLALTFLTNEYAKNHNIKFHALTIDHKLRPESTAEAKKLNELLTNHNINHSITTWHHQEPINSNIEAKARNARYELIANFSTQNNIDLTLVGHHFDDQIENFFIRLERGSGIDGLGLMDTVFVRNNTKFLRPLLNIPKNQLQQYLVSREIKWFEDSSNQNEKFKRNKIRNLIEKLDDKELIKKRIYQTSKHLSRAKSYLNIQTETTFEELVSFNNKKAEINLNSFKKLHEEIAFRLMIKLFNEIGDKIYKPRFEKLETLYEKIINDQINKSTTFANCLIEITQDIIVLSKEITRNK